MNKVYIMVGWPGSGKSTFTREHMHTIPIVSRDEIRFSMVKEDENYFSKEKEVFQRFIEEIVSNLKAGNDVVADATHISKASRKKLMNAINLPVEFNAVCMHIPLEESKRRNNLRTGRAKVPDEVIDSFSKKIQWPTFYEGFSNIYNVYPDNSIIKYSTF